MEEMEEDSSITKERNSYNNEGSENRWEVVGKRCFDFRRGKKGLLHVCVYNKDG